MKPTAFTILAIGLFLAAPTFSAQKNNQKQGKTPSKAAANKSYVDAKNRLREAQNASRKTERELVSARTAASAKHLNASGLAKAQNAARTAVSNLATIRQVVTQRIRETDAHIAATAAAKDAGEKLRQLGTRAKLSDARKKQRRSELSAIVRRPVELEKAAIAEDTTHTRIAREVRTAGQAVAKATTKYQKLLANDAAVKKATKSFNGAKTKLKTAETEVAKKNREVQAATRAEAQAKRQKANKNRNQNNKGKAKGKKKRGQNKGKK